MLRGRKLALTLAFTVLIAVGFGVSCKGFFVQPTLSTIAVGPAAPTIETGSTDNTVQMTVIGDYSDGSTAAPSVAWSSSEPSVATVSAGGLVTSVSTGTTSITATSNVNPSITGSQTVTVTVGCIESIAVTPPGPINLSVSVANDNQQLLDAKATTCNGVIDITDSATWNTSNSTAATVVGGLVTAEATGTTDISAQVGAIVSPAVVVNVGP
jgi:hypothetical protein